MTDEKHELSDKPPRDEDGHPIHPERGHRICGAKKSDKTTPTSHGRERDEFAYCTLAAGWGTDTNVGPCRNHPYEGEQWGDSNPNFKHGATSEYFKSRLSDRQQDVYDEWADAFDKDEGAELLRHVATTLILRGDHMNSPAMVREGRQMLSDFGIVETAPDELELNAQVESESELTLDEETRDVVRNALASKYGVDTDE